MDRLTSICVGVLLASSAVAGAEIAALGPGQIVKAVSSLSPGECTNDGQWCFTMGPPQPVGVPMGMPQTPGASALLAGVDPGGKARPIRVDDDGYVLARCANIRPYPGVE